MKISLITCTGQRPEAFALCQRWMTGQPWDEWIVVDDGEPSTVVTLTKDVLRPFPRWQSEQNTLARNLKLALPHITGDVIFFIEDDDYYPPHYLATMAAWMQREGVDIIGEAKKQYYHLPTCRYRRWYYHEYANLCQTAITKRVADEVLTPMLDKHTGNRLDQDLWKGLESRKGYRRYFMTGQPIVIGIKGMPGRGGLGSGHQPDSEWHYDKDLSILKSWLGNEWVNYLPYVGESQASN